MRLGRQADLARELGVSRAAISQAFKKHNIQVPMDGKFDLDYYGWLLKEKQDHTRSKAQRSAKKQPAGIKDPRVRREVVRHLHQIWEKAVFKTMETFADGFFENKEDITDLITLNIHLSVFWTIFHEICDTEFPVELTDFSYERPKILDIQWYFVEDEQSVMESIIGRRLGDEIE